MSDDEIQRQLKRLRAAVSSVLLVGGTEEQVDAAVRDGIAEVVNGPMANMAERNRRRLEQASA